MKLFRFLLKEPAPGTRNYELLSRYQTLLWRVSGLDRVAVSMTSNPGGAPLRWEPWNPAARADKYIILDADKNDLRISRSSDILSLNTVIDLIKAELKEPELSEILKTLTGPPPFGLNL
jgi:hypothetical protein